MRRCLLPLVLAACLAQPVLAEGAGHAAKPQPGTSVDMPFLIAPLSKDGNLLGYAYISSKLITTSPGASIAVREKIAFIQDANVRDVNAVSIAKSDDPKGVDTAALSQRLVAIAKRIVGGNKVVRVEITAIQFAPLHPDGSTMGMMSSRPEGAAALAAANQANAATAVTPASPPATSEPAKSATH
jgi:hypothetical protein